MDPIQTNIKNLLLVNMVKLSYALIIDLENQ